jgi:hypothetical protein
VHSHCYGIRFTVGTDAISHLFVDGVGVGSSTYPPGYGETFNWSLTLGNLDGDIDELRISNASQ